jgi:hypothetical protein
VWVTLQLNSVYDEHIAGLDAKSAGIVDSKVTMLREHGPNWRSNSLKHLGDDVYELKAGRSRLYFGPVGEMKVIFVECHMKKSKNEQSNKIKRAKILLNELRKMEGHCNVSQIN